MDHRRQRRQYLVHFGRVQLRLSAGDWRLDIRVRVASLENVNDWSKAGVMIRESLAANSRNAFMLVTPGGTRAFQRRSSTGGSTTRTKVLREPRRSGFASSGRGITFTGYQSANGTSWTPTGSATISMTSSVVRRHGRRAAGSIRRWQPQRSRMSRFRVARPRLRFRHRGSIVISVARRAPGLRPPLAVPSPLLAAVWISGARRISSSSCISPSRETSRSSLESPLCSMRIRGPRRES